MLTFWKKQATLIFAQHMHVHILDMFVTISISLDRNIKIIVCVVRLYFSVCMKEEGQEI
jgi:hypothetical protein